MFARCPGAVHPGLHHRSRIRLAPGYVLAQGRPPVARGLAEVVIVEPSGPVWDITPLLAADVAVVVGGPRDRSFAVTGEHPRRGPLLVDQRDHLRPRAHPPTRNPTHHPTHHPTWSPIRYRPAACRPSLRPPPRYTSAPSPPQAPSTRRWPSCVPRGQNSPTASASLRFRARREPLAEAPGSPTQRPAAPHRPASAVPGVPSALLATTRSAPPPSSPLTTATVIPTPAIAATAPMASAGVRVVGPLQERAWKRDERAARQREPMHWTPRLNRSADSAPWPVTCDRGHRPCEEEVVESLEPGPGGNLRSKVIFKKP